MSVVRETQVPAIREAIRVATKGPTTFLMA
jgi:hypothetical protein